MKSACADWGHDPFLARAGELCGGRSRLQARFQPPALVQRGSSTHTELDEEEHELICALLYWPPGAGEAMRERPAWLVGRRRGGVQAWTWQSGSWRRWMRRG